MTGQRNAFFIGMILAALAATATADQLVPAGVLQQDVAIRDVRIDEGRISGTVVNNTDGRISDVTLLMDYAWMWKDEFNPGANNPGFATQQTLPFTLNPGESAEFSITLDRALAERDDGRYNPSVGVMSFTVYK